MKPFRFFFHAAPGLLLCLSLFLASCDSEKQVSRGKLQHSGKKYFEAGHAAGSERPAVFSLSSGFAFLYPNAGLLELADENGRPRFIFNFIENAEMSISSAVAVVSAPGLIGIVDGHYNTVNWFTTEGKWKGQHDLNAPLAQKRLTLHTQASNFNTLADAQSGETILPVQLLDSLASPRVFTKAGLAAFVDKNGKVKKFIGSYPAAYTQKNFSATGGFSIATEGDEVLFAFESNPEVLAFDRNGEVLSSFGNAPEGWQEPEGYDRSRPFEEEFMRLRNESWIFTGLWVDAQSHCVYRVASPPADAAAGADFFKRKKILQRYDADRQLTGEFALPDEWMMLAGFRNGGLSGLGYDAQKGAYYLMDIALPQ